MDRVRIERPASGLGAPLIVEILANPPDLAERIVSATLDQGGVVLVAGPDRFGARSGFGHRSTPASGSDSGSGSASRRAADASVDRRTEPGQSTPGTALEATGVAELLERFGRCLLVEVRAAPAATASSPTTGVERDLEPVALEIDYDPDHTPESLVLALEDQARTTSARVRPMHRSHRRRGDRSRIGDGACRDGSFDALRDEATRDRRVVAFRVATTGIGIGAQARAGSEAGPKIAKMIRTAMLFEAFRHTSFFAETPAGRLCIRVGARCPELDELSRCAGDGEGDGDGDGDGDGSWAYVTAYNPHGQPAPEPENERAQARLLDELREQGQRFYPGASRGDLGDWPPEPSVLILGITEAEAIRLAAHFRQAALVVGRRGEAARLLPSGTT
jgi:hypothetical protein